MLGDSRGLADWSQSTSESWCVAAEALLAFEGKGELPPAERCLALPEGPGKLEALALCSRAAMLRGELDELRRLCSVLGSLGDRGRAWALVFAATLAAGVQEEHRSQAERELAHLVEGQPWPGLRGELALCKGIGAMCAGDLEGALAAVRRASRMLQSDHFWLGHCTASIFLARLRRCEGKPHLARWIAARALEGAGPLLAPWLEWELHMAGGCVALPSLRGSFWWHGEDRSAMTDATCAMHEAPRHSWVLGDAVGPGALSGLVSQHGADVLVLPGGRALRQLFSSKARRIEVKAGRPASLLASLAFAGTAGLKVSEWFAKAYGFVYRPELHGPSFRVARHDARRLLAGVGSILREGERYRLEVSEPVAFADPTTPVLLGERLLRCMASAEKQNAKALAAQLGAPLRSVQEVLRELVEEGVCARVKHGRAVCYEVEDTTYRELTRL